MKLSESECLSILYYEIYYHVIIVLYCNVLCCIVLCCVVLCCVVLCYVMLYYIILYYCIGLSRYIATTTLAIIAVFLEYLSQFLIDLHQIYRHSSVPKTHLPVIFELLSSSGFRARRRRDFFYQGVPVTV